MYMKRRVEKRRRLLAAMALCIALGASAEETQGVSAEQWLLAQRYQEVVVMGSRDSLPLEGLYNGEYVGVMPQFFQRLSQATGLRFTYLDGPGDRYELAANQQCDIVSLVTEDDEALLARGLIAGPECFVFNGESYRIAYTLRMPQPLIELVNTGIAQMSEQEKVQSAIAGAAQMQAAGVPAWLPIAAIGLSVACAGLAVGVVVLVLRHKRRLQQALTMDAATGLYNREGFAARFEKLRAHQSFPLYWLAYLYVDFDQQRLYAGDAEIGRRVEAAAQELKRHMRAEWFAAVVDQQNFLLCFLPQLNQPGEEMILPVLEAVEERLNENQGALRASVCAGLWRCDANQGDFSKTLHDTRIAAHSACEKKERWLVSSQSLTQRATLDFRTARELLSSMDISAFHVYILPLVNLTNGNVVGGQALARWKHPSRGMLLPGEFLPFIEGTEKLEELDGRVFEQMCAWVEKRRQGGMRPMMISCNLSDVTLKHPDCHKKLSAVMRQYGVQSGEIGVEIDTKILKSTAVTVRENIRRLREAGAAVILDNFGSDDTSLCALAACEVDVVKLYSGLLPRRVQDEALLAQGLHVLDNTISLCKRLGVMIAATGVEDGEQHTVVYELGCDFAEGYHYYRPLPCDEFDRSFRGREPDAEAETIPVPKETVADNDERIRRLMNILSGVADS